MTYVDPFFGSSAAYTAAYADLYGSQPDYVSCHARASIHPHPHAHSPTPTPWPRQWFAGRHVPCCSVIAAYCCIQGLRGYVAQALV